MKRIMFLFAAVMSTVFANAMSYSEAREEALYLTDKMAYELNLTEQQYNDAYEINLDYLMGVRSSDEVYGMYWRYRNDDLRSILYDWQWDLFRAADYFFRPLAWHSGAWYLPVRRHYAANHYYYSRPRVYVSYQGGHGRHHYSGGYYHRPAIVHNVNHNANHNANYGHRGDVTVHHNNNHRMDGAVHPNNNHRPDSNRGGGSGFSRPGGNGGSGFSRSGGNGGGSRGGDRSFGHRR